MTHSAIDAALAIQQKYGFNFDEIEKVELFVSKMSVEMVGGPFEIRQNPQVDAQFSIPYTVGVALTKGKPFIDDFADAAVRDENRKAAADKVNVFVGDNIDDRDLKPAAIKVYLKNGKILTGRIDVLKGHPENPLGWEECIEKFKKCAAVGVKKYSDDTIDMVVETVLNLDKLDSAGEVLNGLVAEA